MCHRFSALVAAFCAATVAALAQDGYLFSTIAGKAGVAGWDNGAGPTATFKGPRGIAADNAGHLYVGDFDNLLIRKIDLTGSAPLVTTVAGSTGYGATNGAPGSAAFGTVVYFGPVWQASTTVSLGPRNLAVLNGTIYVVDGNYLIRTVSSSVGTLAGKMITQTYDYRTDRYNTFEPDEVDGIGTAASFAMPYGMVTDGANLYVSDHNGHTIRKVTPAGEVTTFAGIANNPGAVDGAKTQARFRNPTGLAMTSAGELYVLDSGNLTIRKIGTDGNVTTVSGSAGLGGSADGAGAAARFAASPGNPLAAYKEGVGPTGLALTPAGELLAVDTWNHTIRRISRDGVVTTVGGSAGAAGTADGVGAKARFYMPEAITVDAAGIVYIADTGNHIVRKGEPVYAPRIVTQPQGAAVGPGQPLALSVVVATNRLPTTYQWMRNGGPIAGATTPDFSIAASQISDAGDYTVTVTNDIATISSAVAAVKVGVPPAITAQPAAQSVVNGQSLVLSVAATGTPVPAFQWFKQGQPIAGATSATLTIATAQAGDAGTYSVTATNAAGVVTSNAVVVTVNTSRIVNLSIRTNLSAATPVLTVGYVVSGAGKSLLVRAVGPTLAAFGVATAHADPRLTIVRDPTSVLTNDNWDSSGNASQVAATAAQVGAFALPAGSADAALLATLDSGSYSAVVSGPTGASGVVLVELYDANATTAARLVNVSTRAQVGTGENVLVAGFVVAGNAKKALLIRAVGPTLAGFGVAGTLADPKLDVFGAGNAAPLVSNDNWGGSAELQAAFAAQGAFPLSTTASKDAALIVTLEPGNYSAQVSGVGNTTGEALLEIYEMP